MAEAPVPSSKPIRRVNVRRGMFRLWMLFSVIWAAGFLTLASFGWYRLGYYSSVTRDFQISDWKNPQNGEINLVVQSSSGCSYLVKDDERIRINPKIAFSYVANYEKRARPECS